MDPHRKARRTASIAFCLSVLGGAAALAAWLHATRIEPPRREVAKLPPVVATYLVAAQDVEEFFVGFGQAEAIRSATLSAEVNSTVLEVTDGLRPGSPVEARQTLIRLDDREYHHTLERAEAAQRADEAALAELEVDARKIQELIATASAELRVAEDEKRRLAALYENKNAAEREYNVAVMAYQQAQRTLQAYEREAEMMAPRRERLAASLDMQRSNVSIARLNLERCVIRAPFAGRIERLFVDQGDRVGPGSSCATIVSIDVVEIPIQLPAAVYDRIEIGTPCVATTDHEPDQRWIGRIARLSPVIDSATRTFSAYVVVDNREQRTPLVPGAFFRAEIAGPVHRSAMLVPRAALRGGQVLVLDGHAARRRSVSVVRTHRDMAIVRGDIEPGDRVIITHLDALEDGTAVRVADDHADLGRSSTRTTATGAPP